LEAFVLSWFCNDSFGFRGTAKLGDQ
jgi:hypothetical protein